MLARRVRVTGRVQGVFYRAWTRQEARQLGVNGWVQNCVDGSVLAHIEGAEHGIKQLTERMRSGPPGAAPKEVTVEDVEPRGTSGFEIRH